MTQNEQRTGARQRWKTWLRRAIFAMLVIGLLVFCGLAWQVHSYGQQDQAAAADVIVVLGAGLEQDGTVNPAMHDRIVHGAALYAAGYAPYVICSGGFTVSVPVSEAEVCADLLIESGVPPGAIIIEDHSRSTEENAIYTAAIMRGRGWARALLASDNFHLWRARLLFEARGVAVLTSPAQITAGERSPFEYGYAVGREVLALLWQRLKDTLGLPITYVP